MFVALVDPFPGQNSGRNRRWNFQGLIRNAFRVSVARTTKVTTRNCSQSAVGWGDFGDRRVCGLQANDWFGFLFVFAKSCAVSVRFRFYKINCGFVLFLFGFCTVCCSIRVCTLMVQLIVSWSDPELEVQSLTVNRGVYPYLRMATNALWSVFEGNQLKV